MATTRKSLSRRVAVGDRFGRGGLSNAELLGRFRHDARLHDRKEHMESHGA